MEVVRKELEDERTKVTKLKANIRAYTIVSFIVLSQSRGLREELERERRKAKNLEMVRQPIYCFLAYIRHVDSWTSIPSKMW